MLPLAEPPRLPLEPSGAQAYPHPANLFYTAQPGEGKAQFLLPDAVEENGRRGLSSLSIPTQNLPRSKSIVLDLDARDYFAELFVVHNTARVLRLVGLPVGR